LNLDFLAEDSFYEWVSGGTVAFGWYMDIRNGEDNGILRFGRTTEGKAYNTPDRRWSYDNSAVLETRFQIANTTTASYLFGFSKVLTGGTNPQGHYFVWNASTNNHWYAKSKNASGVSFVDTGIAVSSLDFHEYRIEFNEENMAVNFYIDNTLVHTETNNVEQTEVLGDYFQVDTTGFGNAYYDLDYVKIWQDRIDTHQGASP